ncbi:MAG: amidase [Acidimicrobiales bacterium]
MSTDISDLIDNGDATTVAAAVHAGEVHPRELVAAAIGRAEERNSTLNAFVSTRFDEALDEAEHVDTEAPFAGVPFVVKDLGAEVAGLPHTRGSRLFAEDTAVADSELVARYRRAGFLVLGTTNAPEMGKNASTEPVLHGPTRNPHGLGHSSGGSSGGTAAAVAAGIVPIGHGNDGGGSIRIPAAACGLFGLKPSRGRVTTHPARSLLSYPMGIDHVLTRSVRDSASVLDATAGPMVGDPYQISSPKRPWIDEVGAHNGALTIAMSTSARDDEQAHPDCVAATEQVAETLTALGHRVVPGVPEYPVEAMGIVMRTLMGVPLAVKVERRLAELGRELRDDDLEPFTRFMYDSAASVPGTAIIEAMELVETVSRDIGSFFVEHDLLLTPTLPQPTPPLGFLDTTDLETMFERAGIYASLTSPFNMTGQPAVSMPLATDSTGMPVGVQLVAAYGREDLLVSTSSQLEAATPWSIAPVWPPREA